MRMKKRTLVYVAMALIAGLVVAYVVMNKPEPSAQPVPEPPKPVKVFWADGTALNMADPADNLVWLQAKRELASAGFGDEQLASGYVVELTIDPKAQRAANRILKETLAGQPENLRTALVAVAPKTGRVIAYSGYHERKPDVDFAASWQNPGHTFTPFVLLAMLQKDSTRRPDTETFDGRSGRAFGGAIVNNPPGVDCGAQCTVATAMKDSVNVVFTDIAFNMVGLRAVAQAAVDAGIPTNIGEKSVPLEGSPPDGGLDLNIANGGGRYVARPLDMAGAYATFAADGTKHTPHLVAKMKSIEDGSVVNDGVLVYDGDQTWSGKPALDTTDEAKNAKIARTVTETLLPAGVPCADNRPCASKAGIHGCPEKRSVSANAVTTRDDSCATWMVGYAPQLSTAVWVGSEDQSALKDKAGKVLGGKDLAGAAWQAFMNDYLTGKPVEQFPPN
nr:Multimodular transpeptidase-transglycosylase (EC 2.4.1.129) (EC 3.4.-.-) [Kibdelosporangium sp. MJ126-NF4]